MKSKRKWLILAAAVLAIAAALFLLLRPKAALVRSGNLIVNGDFSAAGENGLPDGWYTDAYINTAGYTDYSLADGVATIVNYALNDARFAQDVPVQPDTLYCLSGEVRAKAQGGLGGNVSVADVYVFSESVYDSGEEWVPVRVYGRTGKNQHSVTVFARLGGYSGEALGTASFRSISLEQVDSVPPEYIAYQWYKSENKTTGEDEEGEHSAWPWLLGVAAIYAAACFGLRSVVMAAGAGKKKRRDWAALAAVLAIAAVVRCLIARRIPGYGVDIGCFTAWANMMASQGAANFYSSGIFCDYPPGYILVLGLLGKIGQWRGTGATEMLVKLPSILCDLAAAAVLFCFARKRMPPKGALALAAIYAFNPVTLAAGAAWGQADSVMALLILLVVVLAVENRWAAALPLYVLAVLMKPQALMFGPLGLLALVYVLICKKERRLLIHTGIGLGLSVAVALAVVLPFSKNMEDPLWLVSLYQGTMGYYANVTVNACNLYFLFGKNWISVEQTAEWYVRLCAMALMVGGMLSVIARDGLYRQGKRYLAFAALMAAALMAVTAIPMPYQTLGMVVIVCSVLLCAALYVLGGEIRHLPLLGALLLMLLCNLGVMMHERYLFPALLLLAMACVLERDRRVYLLFAVLTVSVFLNVGLVLDRGVRIGGAAGHLDAPAFSIDSDSAALEYIVSALNCLLTVYAGAVGLALCAEGKAVTMKAAARREKTACAAAAALPDPALQELTQPGAVSPMQRLDWLLMLGVTVVYAVVSLVNLGSATSPQTWWRSTADSSAVVLDLGEVRDMNMLYLGGIHNRASDFSVQVSDDGVHWSAPYWAQMREGDCFKWQYLPETSYSVTYTLDGGENWSDEYWTSKESGEQYVAEGEFERSFDYYYQNKAQYFRVEYAAAEGDTIYEMTVNYTNTPTLLTGRYVKIEALNIATTLYEIVLRDPGSQAVYPTKVISGDGAHLVDEPYEFMGEPGWYNSTYFDEIYHARTGYEHYLAMRGDYTYRPYETSHPPLGKVLMAISISIFGMTPFGWRFAGALAGILMLPGMYLLGKLLTRRRLAAFAAMFLMAADCMHFTQTRIATIDSFVVLFIIWSFVFMVYYIRMDYWKTALWKTLVPLGLSGLCMGLAVASKWTGCYAGVGLALLFFWSLYRRFRQSQVAKEVQCERSEEAAKGIWRRPVITLASCLVFFVAVPAAIYYISYIPYFLPSGGVSLKRIIQAAQGMLSYHSQPGLGMDHPFYSPWYEWPVIAKPMWYYSSSYHPAGETQTIAAFGNPTVWWGGLAALVIVALLWLARHIRRNGSITLHTPQNDMRPAILLIAFAAQYVPWTLVPRGTYIYHYFPSVPFVILCMALCLDLLADATAQPVVLPKWHARFIARWQMWFGGSAGRKWQEMAEQTVTLRLQYIAVVLTVLILLAALALFIAFFPYASGVMTSMRWLRAMQWFSGWLYY